MSTRDAADRAAGQATDQRSHRGTGGNGVLHVKAAVIFFRSDRCRGLPDPLPGVPGLAGFRAEDGQDDGAQ